MLSSVPPPPGPAAPAAAGDLWMVGAERRFQTWFAYYVMALFGIIAAEIGTVYGAVFVIGCTELVMSFWRATPKLSETSYSTTLGPAWQAPVRALRLFLLARQFASYGIGFVVATLFAGFFIVVARPKSLGVWNAIVVGIFVAYYGTRPLWYPAVRSRITPVFKQFNQQVMQGRPRVHIAADGIDIAPFYVPNGPRRDPTWHVGFAEIDEMRTMGALDAQAYWQSMEMYDPTLGVRVVYELEQYATGHLARPTVYQVLSTGQHLLIRGPRLVYMLPNAEQFAQAAISAWQQWRAAQPPAQESSAGNLHG